MNLDSVAGISGRQSDGLYKGRSLPSAPNPERDTSRPCLDHFDLGLEAARKEDEQAVIVQGMTMVKKQLDEFLRANHVETIDGEGEEFDPHLHEAMSQEASDSVESGRVIRQIRRGYRLRDRLLRPAAVIVSSGSGETAGAQPGGAEPEGE